MEEIVKVFGLDAKLFAIQLLNFGLVVFILTKLLYKPVINILEERRQRIEEGIQNAKKAELSLYEALKEASFKKEEAREASERVLREAKESADQLYERTMIETSALKAKILDETNAESRILKEKAITEAKEDIAKLAVLAAEKILREKTN